LRLYFRFERMNARTHAGGNDKLSDRNVGVSKSAEHKGKKLSGDRAGESRGSAARDGGGKGRRGKKSGDIGRALRSVYDETLRENVPDDFLDLLGKLS